jgi:hypothetical protein
MKTKHLCAGLLLAGTILAGNAQTIDETATLTSGGLTAGTGGSNNTFFGYQAGKITTGASNTFIGNEAGLSTTTTNNNTFLGYRAGQFNIGSSNTFLGRSAGSNNTSGGSNIFIGADSGTSTTTGASNIYIGGISASGNTSGNYNVYIGQYAGSDSGSAASDNVYLGSFVANHNNGSGNVCIGKNAGTYSTSYAGSGNVFIGRSAGQNIFGSDLLCIESSATPTNAPLIWGNFATDQLKFNGKVGINFGTSSIPNSTGGVALTTYKLFVKGGILSDEMRVTPQTQWADYVFADDYALPSLAEVECYIAENGHLPNVPSAQQVKEEGIELGTMANIQQEKIEELTLYIIAQQKEIDKEKARNEAQENEIKELKAMVQQMLEKQ